MTELSSRQFILVALFVGITSKLMSMPIEIYKLAHNDAIFTIILGLVVELAIVILVAHLIKKYPHTRLIDLLKEHFGSIIAYTVIVLLYLLIIVKLFFALEEVYTFFKEFLYDYFNPVIFGLAMFFVVGYLSYKGARTLGRTLEILFPIIMIGLLITLISNVEFLKFTKMLPYLTTGVLPTLDSFVHNAFYFGNALPLLFFVGKVRIDDNFIKKVTLSYSGLIAFVAIFSFMFYDLFGYGTILAIFALSDYSQYNPYILDLQRLNWLSIIVNVTKLFCSASLLLYCLGQAGKMLTHAQSSFWPIVVSFGINFFIAAVVSYDMDTIKYLVNLFISYYTIALILIVLILTLILCIKKEAKCPKHYSIK